MLRSALPPISNQRKKGPPSRAVITPSGISAGAISVLDLIISVLMDREKEMDRMLAELSRLASILGDLTDRLENLVEEIKEIKKTP